MSRAVSCQRADPIVSPNDKTIVVAIFYPSRLFFNNVHRRLLCHAEEDTISELSFSHDGKKVVFDRCNKDCQIQVYDLETGKLAAYQSPKEERWTMAKYSYDGSRITFSVIPVKSKNLQLNEMQIAVMDADGKNFKKVTTGPGAKLYPAFSHNGKKILYARAAHIREGGGTPASQYDAWEVNLETGEQTQLTFYKYYHMGYLTYYPDDEKFVYYGELPGEFEGVPSYRNESAFQKKMIELGKKGMGIHGIVVMKGKELIPNPYDFPPETFPQKPLLSKNGSTLIYEKSHSGDFYLYSAEGKHRRVFRAGSLNSATVSPNVEQMAVCYDDYFLIRLVKDDSPLFAVYSKMGKKNVGKWDEKDERDPKLKTLPDVPHKKITVK